VIGLFLIVEMPHACNEWSVALAFCPHDGFMLRFVRTQYVIGMVLDDIVVNVGIKSFIPSG
jgi:hypothetical protein